MQENRSDKFLIPISIIVAGLLIGGGVYLKGRAESKSSNIVKEAVKQSQNIRSIEASDHLLGNPKARIVIVEYSDTECPFCKQFHSTLRGIMQDYGSAGSVAWVYRHFPIAELHSKAPHEAEALECASELGGNAKFWEYTNRIYEVTPSNNDLDPGSLTDIAKQVGLSSSDFNTCLNSGKYTAKVTADIKDAENAGGEGTPYSILLDTKTGSTYPMPGAQDSATIKGVIDLILGS
jgi:protein-disulfide isomerase